MADGPHGTGRNRPGTRDRQGRKDGGKSMPQPGWWILLALLVCATSATAAVYTWRDENGVLQFSDRPPLAADGKQAPQVETIEVPEISTVSVRRLPESLADPGATPGPDAGAAQRVVMYSAAWCGVCKRARAYFQRRQIRYTEKDIEQSPQARAEFRQLGGRGVPLILVGRQQLAGFSPASFERIYRP